MKAQGQELGWDPEQFHQTVLHTALLLATPAAKLQLLIS
jgi:hypothetical protein